jgi:hypothetical protein
MADGVKYFLLLLMCTGTSPLATAAQPNNTPWNVIGGSDVIVVGTIVDVIEGPVHKGDPGAADSRSGKLEVVVHKVLKGRAPDRLRTDYFVSIGWSDELLSTIRELRGKTAILFMLAGSQRGDHEPWFDMPAIYGADAIATDSPEAEQRIKDELAREPLQVSEAAVYLSKLDGGNMESQVQAAIEDMASDHQGQIDTGEEQLRKLGCNALPYIIKHLDDRRPFRGTVKGPSSWEGYAQYGAKQMTDALVMVLGFITDPVRPDRDEFGVDDAERRKMIDSWLLYIAHHRTRDQGLRMALPDMCASLQFK